jgi:WD40 repeat protein
MREKFKQAPSQHVRKTSKTHRRFPDERVGIRNMKTIITHIAKPALRRGLRTFLVGASALWALAIAAHAAPVLWVSIYPGAIYTFNSKSGKRVTPSISANAPEYMAFSPKIKGYGITLLAINENNGISQYDTKTGALINGNFVAPLNGPAGMAVSGDNLFVAYSQNGIATVNEYNAKTGALIKANFIEVTTGYPTDNSEPAAIAVYDNTILVAYIGRFGPAGQGIDAIGQYNAQTGATMNFTFITLLSTYPAATMCLAGSNLYVTYFSTQGTGGTVSEFDAATGTAINTSLISGLPYTPAGIVVSSSNVLYLSEAATVSEYNATNGVAINLDFINLNGVGGPQALLLQGE